jgi:hypothetical protein
MPALLLLLLQVGALVTRLPPGSAWAACTAKLPTRRRPLKTPTRQAAFRLSYNYICY